MSKEPEASGRRSFLGRLNAGAAALAGVALGSRAQAQTPGTWRPARHEKDDWMDQLPGKHRLVFDTTLPAGAGEAVYFAANYIAINESDYGISNTDLAVIIIFRYQSVAFGYNDAMWAKYGKAIVTRSGNFQDPKTKDVPKANLYNADGYSEVLANRGVTLNSLTKQGVQLAVCNLATKNMSIAIAKATDGVAESIYKELTSNLVVGARLVPAGIVAVNRAQERGYTLVAS
jgi:intracellular sulfur oxidation DsrE/DsrF family protein